MITDIRLDRAYTKALIPPMQTDDAVFGMQTGVDGLVVKSHSGKIDTPPLAPTNCADVMAVSDLLTGVFSLAAIYVDLTGVKGRGALPILTAEAV